MTYDTTHKPRIVLIDNRDSFVYNLLDAFAVEGLDCTVYRNTIPVDRVLAAKPDLICLSPGPSHPRDAGNMMELIDACIGKIPLLGICLGYQALLEHFGGSVGPCGPVHGTTDDMILTDAGLKSPIFDGLTVDGGPELPGALGRRVPIARYHSLGCTRTPQEMVSLAECNSEVGPVTMAGMTKDGMALGLQFHPESVLSPAGPHILYRSVHALLSAGERQKRTANTTQGTSTMTDVHARLRHFLDNPTPQVDEVRNAFEPLTTGEYSDVETTALLVTLRARGETPNDIAGAAAAFLDAATPLPVKDRANLMDSCGTGGDGANTINISTAAAMIAAAAGIPMVKHGNRSVSSKSGSADVLEALGIPLDLTPDEAVKQLKETNFTFLFAPRYHPAIAHVMPVRKALKIPTIFNVLGPLLNPARPDLQLMGVASEALGEPLIEVMKTLGRRRALIVHGYPLDEIAVHGPTKFWELKEDGTTTSYTLTPEELGIHTHSLDSLVGGDGKENARILTSILSGQASEALTDAVTVNAGALFYLAGKADSLEAGTAEAKKLVTQGTVAQWLAQATH